MINQQNKKGFTIIEVVLVLAIAGLIFLMVFIALPALQRSQRDQARKNDASVVAAAVNSFYSSNRGSTAISTDELRKYVDKLDQYNKDTELMVTATNATNVTASLDRVWVAPGKKCPASLSPGTTTVDFADGSSRNAAIVILLENNGSQQLPYCQEI